MAGLNELQYNVLKYAVEGHNVLITGQCGTGKTHLLRCIITKLKQNKAVAVTSTTGMASTQLGFGATTVHHWSELGDARFSKEELSTIFNSDDRFIEARKQISSQALVIDELGMMSEVFFDKLEYICRLARNSKRQFGGLQVVRQSEKRLVKAINQLCNGNPDAETEMYLKGLSRPLDDDHDMCRLFGTNFDAAYGNQVYLDQYDGQPMTFKATDEGKSALLANCGGEKILVLKVGVPVILVRNLPAGLYNGLKGNVERLNREGGPTVNFGGRIVKLEKLKFELYDPGPKKVLASRLQYPIKLGFAMTVHRAQGLTLKKVEIDCSSFFAAGQMGVAVGRATCTDGLRIVNYNSTAAHLQHPQEVCDFYTQESFQPVNDLCCCVHDLSSDGESDDDSYGADLSASASLTPEHGFNVPSTSAVTVVYPCPWPTDQFIESDKGKSFMPKASSDNFRGSLKNHAFILYNNLNKSLRELKSPDHFVRLYKEANLYLTSDEHVRSSASLESPKPQKLSLKLYLWLIDMEIEKRSANVCESQLQTLQNEQALEASADLSDAAKAKIRNVAGAFIHKIIYRLRSNVFKNLGKLDAQTKSERDWNLRRYKILNSLRISEDDILKTTAESKSLAEIDFRQGPSRGLIHIADNVFHFLIQLNAFLQSSCQWKHVIFIGRTCTKL